MATLPLVRVTFDDGETLLVQSKPRDLALAERDFGMDYSQGGTAFRGVYATALAALGRMQRAGELNGRVLPATIDELMDVADVEAMDDEDEDAPFDTGQAPTTG